MSKYDEFITQYEKGVGMLKKSLDGISESELDRVPAPGKWTIRQIVAHLTDAELVAVVRMRWVAAEPNAPIKAWNQDLWTQRLDYSNRDPQNDLQLFALLRKSTANLLRFIPEAAWSNKGIHDERGELSLLDFVKGYIEHCNAHARQISAIRSGMSVSA